MKLLYGYILFMVVLAASVLVMPFTSKNGITNNTLMYISGGLFWLGLIGTIVMAVVINNHRKRNSKLSKTAGSDGQLGLIHFFQNKEASVCDVIMIASLVCFIGSTMIRVDQVVQFILLATFIFSFGMHCMLNGINYKIIKNKQGGKKL